MISLLLRKLYNLLNNSVALSFLSPRCSEHLVKSKIAAAGKIGINGVSNGGKQLCDFI